MLCFGEPVGLDDDRRRAIGRQRTFSTAGTRAATIISTTRGERGCGDDGQNE